MSPELDYNKQLKASAELINEPGSISLISGQARNLTPVLGIPKPQVKNEVKKSKPTFFPRENVSIWNSQKSVITSVRDSIKISVREPLSPRTVSSISPRSISSYSPRSVSSYSSKSISVYSSSSKSPSLLSTSPSILSPSSKSPSSKSPSSKSPRSLSPGSKSPFSKSPRPLSPSSKYASLRSVSQSNPMSVRSKKAALIIIDIQNTEKKNKQIKRKNEDFLGNTRTDKFVGLFKRDTIITGDKRTAKQLVIDKKSGTKKSKRKKKSKKTKGSFRIV